MSRRKDYRKNKDLTVKMISLLAISAFMFGNPAFAADDTGAVRPAYGAEKTIGPDEITVPAQYGKVTEAWRPQDTEAKPLIIHIQDAHCNYEAQKNVAGILEHLIKEYNLWTVMVEAGKAGKDYSLFTLRDKYTHKALKSATEKLLKQGELTGTEALTATTDYGTRLIGAEDRALYDENMRAFLKVDAFKAEAVKLVEGLGNAVSNVKEEIYPQAAKELEKAQGAYNKEETDLKAYLAVLKETADGAGIFIGGNDLSGYLNVLELENGIDFNQVNKERTDLIAELTETLEKPELDAMLKASADFREGRLSQSEYYKLLIGLSVNASESAAEQMLKYAEYIAMYEAIDISWLFKQIDIAYDTILKELLNTPEQKQLMQISKDLGILSNLVNLRLTPDEYDYFRANMESFVVSDWVFALEGMTGEPMAENYSLLDKFMPTLDAFYIAAQAREKAMVENTLKYAGEYKDGVIALRTGGFHTPVLTKLLKEAQTPYVVISPKITTKLDTNLYHSALKTSWVPSTMDRDPTKSADSVGRLAAQEPDSEAHSTGGLTREDIVKFVQDERAAGVPVTAQQIHSMIEVLGGKKPSEVTDAAVASLSLNEEAERGLRYFLAGKAIGSLLRMARDEAMKDIPPAPTAEEILSWDKKERLSGSLTIDDSWLKQAEERAREAGEPMLEGKELDEALSQAVEEFVEEFKDEIATEKGKVARVTTAQATPPSAPAELKAKIAERAQRPSVEAGSTGRSLEPANVLLEQARLQKTQDASIKIFTAEVALGDETNPGIGLIARERDKHSTFAIATHEADKKKLIDIGIGDENIIRAESIPIALEQYRGRQNVTVVLSAVEAEELSGEDTHGLDRITVDLTKLRRELMSLLPALGGIRCSNFAELYSALEKAHEIIGGAV